MSVDDCAVLWSLFGRLYDKMDAPRDVSDEVPVIERAFSG